MVVRGVAVPEQAENDVLVYGSNQSSLTIQDAREQIELHEGRTQIELLEFRLRSCEKTGGGLHALLALVRCLAGLSCGWCLHCK